MVRPASSDKWKALLKSGSLCYSRFHIIYNTMLQSSLENWVLHHEVSNYLASSGLEIAPVSGAFANKDFALQLKFLHW